jgi:uncharacterized protein YjbI with pentapeptide repeats
MNPVLHNLKEKKYGGMAYGYLVSGNSFKKFYDDCLENDFYIWESITFQGGSELQSCAFYHKLEIKRCNFDNLKLTGVTFEDGVSFFKCEFAKVELANITSKSQFVIKNSTFKQDVLINGDFERAKYEVCTFNDSVIFTGVYKQSVDFVKCNFHGMAKWKGRLSKVGQAELSIINVLQRNELDIGAETESYAYRWARFAEFFKSRIFEIKNFFIIKHARGTHRIKEGFAKFCERFFIPSATKISSLFEGSATFEDVCFSIPDQVYFSRVNLSETIFSTTDLRGVHLEGVSFYQPRLKRHGLKDELLLSYHKDKATNLHYLPLLESACRKMRVCLEESKDFGIATDLYVGEMEAKRKQLHFLRRNILSTEALFRLVSNYGQSAFQAFLVLTILILIHFYISLSSLDHLGLSGFFINDINHTLRVVSFQNVDRGSSDSHLGIIDTLFRILVPIQAGMFALALRIKIKRH